VKQTPLEQAKSDVGAAQERLRVAQRPMASGKRVSPQQREEFKAATRALHLARAALDGLKGTR
jgi:hypothetical protein